MVAIAIARQTVREALRRRVFWIFLIVAVFLIGLGPVLGFLTPKESQTIMRSLGLAVILLAGLFITIVTCIYLIPVEIERRTIYTVLSKPVQRFEFVLGKFLGGFAIVFLSVAAMGAVFLALDLFPDDHEARDRTDGIFRWIVSGKSCRKRWCWGVVLTFFQMMLLAALNDLLLDVRDAGAELLYVVRYLHRRQPEQRDRIVDHKPLTRSPASSATSFTICCRTSATSNIQNAIIHPTSTD